MKTIRKVAGMERVIALITMCLPLSNDDEGSQHCR